MDGQHWLLVSKPLRAPLRDGSQVLVRHLIEGLPERFAIDWFGDPGEVLRPPGRGAALAAPALGYAPGFASKARMLATLFQPRQREAGLHFFFTPNRLTSSVLVALRRLAPGRPVIQTLTSSHEAGREARWLRPLDAVVALSEHTRRALVDAGIDPARVHRIHPAVPEAARSADLAAARRLLYAGDLDPRVVERLAGVARALRRPGLERWRLTLACRPKDAAHAVQAEHLAALLEEDLAAGRVELLGEVADMDALLRESTLQLFAADHVRRKVDLPLVLLEGLARGIPLLALDVPPVNEIFGLGRRHGLAPGRLVDPRGGSEALAEAAVAAAARPDVLLGWGADAHLLWRREFDVAGMVKQYAGLYDAIEASRGRG